MFKKVMILHVLGLLLSVMIPSCCGDYVEITGLSDLVIWEEASSMQVDTVQGAFTASYGAETKFHMADAGLISGAYAVSCDHQVINPLVEQGARLFFKSPFLFKGDTVPARTNLLGLHPDLPQVDFGYSSGEYHTFEFRQQLLAQCIFDSLPYELVFQTKSIDSVEFRSKATIYFRLD